MKGLFKYCFLPLLFLSGFVKAQQDSSFVFLKSVKGDIVDFAVDNMDNLYLFNSTDQLKKISAGGDSVAVFNDVRKFGKVSYADVSNPLRVLLYFRNFSTIVILDRLLNIRSTIDLRKQNIFQVQAIGLSYDNNIWLYDELDNKLKKIDETGKLLLETPDFRQLFDDVPSPQRIYDEDGLVYLYDKQKAIYVFDYYGSLRNKILITGWDNFKVVGRSVLGTTGNSMNRYRIDLFRIYDEQMPDAVRGFKKVEFTPTKFYALKENEIEVYRFQ
ncbi:MAG: hypothetical protein GC171_13500 [Terrimonas sp.]|nr:hypothetical protein [Terrimonas sp.]